MPKSKSKTRTAAKIPNRSRKDKGKSESDKSRASHIEIIARGCLIEASCVLLCRSDKHGYLYLPGGHVEFDESATHALAREFLEECALRVQVGALALVSEGAFSTRKRRHHELNLVFHVERHGPAAALCPSDIKSREPGISFQWVDLSAVIDHDVRPAAAKAWLSTLASSVDVRPEWVSEMPA